MILNILIFFIALCELAILHAEEKFTFARPLMGTEFSIVCFAEDRAAAEHAAAAAFTKAGELNAVASDYISTSELCSLSKLPTGVPHRISPLLFELLLFSRRGAEITNGTFDPTLGHFTKLWRSSCISGRMPATAALSAARAASGWQQFSLDEKFQRITLHQPAMAFDLGGLAKGYAADFMLETMARNAVRKVLITAGGDIRIGEAPPGKDGWNIAIKTFHSEKMDEILTLTNAAISTSGDLHQQLVIDGVTHSHILDPATGLGLTKRVSATIIAETAKLSDLLATAACVSAARSGKNTTTASLSKIPGVREVKITILAE